MNSRDTVLHRVRAALAGPPGDHAAVVVPRQYRTSGSRSPAEVIERFAAHVGEYRAAVTRTHIETVSDHLVARLTEVGHTTAVAPAGLDPGWLSALAESLDIRLDAPPLTTEELDRVDVVVTAAAVGIADTGTIVLDGAADQGRRAITLVPDHHVCVIRTDQIVETVAEALARLEPTRPQTWISGPSATSDIELDRVEGVHGPRRLDVIIADAHPGTP